MAAWAKPVTEGSLGLPNKINSYLTSWLTGISESLEITWRGGLGCAAFGARGLLSYPLAFVPAPPLVSTMD